MRINEITLIAGVLAAVITQPVIGLDIKQVEPTPLFPKPASGQPLKQLVRVTLDNPDAATAASVRVTVGSGVPETQPIQVAKGKSVVTVLVPDISVPTPVTLAVVGEGGQVLATRKVDWQPEKKWTLLSCGYSHQDLGYGDYPHRLRTSNRHANILLPLRYCRETDTWPDDAKYRFNIETSEPVTSFIGFQGKAAGRELGARMKEGRISVGGLHSTVSTEQLGHELMARLFYLSGRHTPDLIGSGGGKTMINNDVVGLTLPLATYAKEAGYDYCFHGYNRLCMPNVENGRWLADFHSLDFEQGRHIFEIGNEPNFFWRGPDGQSLLRRATTYERHDLLDNPYQNNPPPVQDPRRVEKLIRGHEKIKWPFSTLLSQDGGDFILVRRTISDRAWVARGQPL